MEKKACIVIQIYGVIMYIVCIDSINMKEKKVIIEQISSKNIASILDLKIKWIRWLSNPVSRKKETLLVIKCKTAAHVNGAIAESLAIKAELYWCIMYNPACKQKQCFKCNQYGYLAVHYINTQVCRYCAAVYQSQEIKSMFSKSAFIVKELMRYKITIANLKKEN